MDWGTFWQTQVFPEFRFQPRDDACTFKKKSERKIMKVLPSTHVRHIPSHKKNVLFMLVRYLSELGYGFP